MCRGRRTHIRWLGLGGMHCKLPCTADVGRAEPWHNWQEGGRGGSNSADVAGSCLFLFDVNCTFLRADN